MEEWRFLIIDYRKMVRVFIGFKNRVLLIFIFDILKVLLFFED